MVNLRASFKDGSVIDPRVLRKKALDIEQDLKDWKATVPQAWHYDVVDAGEAASDTCFEGKRHIYGNIWVGEIWNNWRVLRILVNQILYQNEDEFDTPDEHLKATTLSIIHEHSTQICESSPHFANSSREYQTLVRCPHSTKFVHRYPIPHPATICRVSREA